MKKFGVIGIVSLLMLLCGCEFTTYDEDYYHSVEKSYDNVIINVQGKGYGKYGQLLDKYITNVDDIFTNEGFSISSGTADVNNGISSNEITVAMDFNEPVKHFECQFEILKKYGFDSISISEKSVDGTVITRNELLTNYSSSNTNIDNITIVIKLLKFYPEEYNNFKYKNEIPKKEYIESYKGKQVNNIFKISNITTF